MKKEKKETAVDWLFNQMFDPTYPAGEQMEWLEQAKEMEKEQIRKAYCDGEYYKDTKLSTDYYEQIYGGNDQ